MADVSIADRRPDVDSLRRDAPPAATGSAQPSPGSPGLPGWTLDPEATSELTRITDEPRPAPDTPPAGPGRGPGGPAVAGESAGEDTAATAATAVTGIGSGELVGDEQPPFADSEEFAGGTGFAAGSEFTGVLPPVHESWLPSEHPLFRPRHGRRQRAALSCAAVFFVLPLLLGLLGVHGGDLEHRRLADFPSPADGFGFFTGLSGWASDRFPLRGVAVAAEQGVSEGLFREPAQLNRSSAPVGPVAPTTQGPAGPTAAASTPTPNSGDPQVIEGSDGWLYYGFDVQGKCSPAQPLPQVFAAVDRLRTAVQASGRQFVLLVAPDKTTAEPQHLPASYAGKDCAAAASAQFWSMVDAQPGAIDLRGPLADAAAQAGQPVYHQLDTHWTDRGAVVMTEQLAGRLVPGITGTWTTGTGFQYDTTPDLPRLLGRQQSEPATTLTLAPDGTTDRSGRFYDDLSKPVALSSAAAPGMITKSVSVLGDSFMVSGSRYLAAGFSNALLVNYGTLATNAPAVMSMVINSQVVVFEVVERNLASGAATFIEPGVTDELTTALAGHPLR